MKSVLTKLCMIIVEYVSRIIIQVQVVDKFYVYSL